HENLNHDTFPTLVPLANVRYRSCTCVTFEIDTFTVLKLVGLPVVGIVIVPITAPVGESSRSSIVFPPYPLAAAIPAAKLCAPAPKSMPRYATQSPWSRLVM